MRKSTDQILRMDRGKVKTMDHTHISTNEEQKNGFTLVEVMVAMVILLVGMLAVMSMQYYAINGNASSRELRNATNLGTEIIEQLKATPYADLAPNNDAPPLDDTASGGINFTRAWWVLPDCVAITFNPDNNTCAGVVPACDKDPDPTMAVPVSAVRVRSCWTDKDGAIHSATLDSMRWDENGSI